MGGGGGKKEVDWEGRGGRGEKKEQIRLGGEEEERIVTNNSSHNHTCPPPPKKHSSAWVFSCPPPPPPPTPPSLPPTCAWYFKSFLIFPVVKFHISTNPSALPVTRYWPSGEKEEHSGYDLVPNLIVLVSTVGYFSSSMSLMAALPLREEAREILQFNIGRQFKGHNNMQSVTEHYPAVNFSICQVTFV